MDEQSRILELGQSIYLAKNNRYNDVEGEEATEFALQTVDWVNQWIDELEVEADWNYVRRNLADLGTVTAGTDYIELPPEVRTLVVNQYRSVMVSHDGNVVARFTVVSPSQITSSAEEGIVENRATLIGRRLYFSRDFVDTEEGGHILADVIDYIPRLSLVPGEENVEMLDLVKPRQLIVLGVAKNSTLPDIVQGGTSPSHTQKYNDLLAKAITENNRTSQADIADRESFAYIGGIW